MNFEIQFFIYISISFQAFNYMFSNPDYTKWIILENRPQIAFNHIFKTHFFPTITMSEAVGSELFNFY